MKPTTLHWNLSHSYRSLPQAFFSDAQPARFPRPQVLLFNQPLARELGLLPPEDATAPDAGAVPVPVQPPIRQCRHHGRMTAP